MGKGKRFLKKLLKDRKDHICRLYCDKLQIEDKLNEIGGKKKEKELRAKLAKLTKEQNEKRDDDSEKGKQLADEIRKTNNSIDLIAGLQEGMDKTNLQIIEFERYVKVLKNILKDSEAVKKFNEIWYQ